MAAGCVRFQNCTEGLGGHLVRPTDLSFMKRRPFWLFETGNIMQSLAYFVPQLWIPSFAASLGFPSFSGPLALSLLNVAACFGYLLHGILVDRFHVTVAILASTIGSMISIFIFWGLTASQTMLYLFAVIWGATGGGYAACWSGCAMAMRKQSNSNNLDTGLVISLMCAGKGVASLISGPLSEALLSAGSWKGAEFAYGSQYGGVIVFAGVAAMFGGTACIGRAFKML
ncbi:hypothetical protein LTR37_019898 [Vermiconidia calcicola]|uniref:Uncharacterized protein n=1 Tax=Vermiconidia calcicola TaxID=1690605 RepID=A0ACC3MCT2_9PEZI|nr:hypothetical protein LTR37_019898 [Vermiconidia calcicola]